MSGISKIFIKVFGETLLFPDAVKKFGVVGKGTVKSRLSRGWTLEKALTCLPQKGVKELKLVEALNCSGTLSKVIRQYGIPRSTVRNRLKRGWDLERALTSPASWPRGKDNVRWKGGVTPLNHAIRHCTKMEEWTKSVYKRDGNRCRYCHLKRKLNAHHIAHLADLIQLYKIKSVEDAEKIPFIWDVSNGITLCEPCHIYIHSITGKRVSK